MKRKITVMLCMLLCMVCGITMVTGCGPKEPDYTRKYVIFSNGIGKEKVRLDYPGAIDVYYDYDENKGYDFTYTVYYEENDCATGEWGQSYIKIYANKPGTYHIVANVNLGERGRMDYVLRVHIREKPDLRVEPEVRFDANGATVEERDGKTVYVYKYEEWNSFQWPILRLLYNGKEIVQLKSCDGIKSITNLETNTVTWYPHFPNEEIGTYKVYYVFSEYAKEDMDKYKRVETDIIVEVRN